MKNVQLSEEAYATLQRLATAQQLTPSDALEALLGSGRPICGDHLRFHLAGGQIAQASTPADRYLALLAWVARHHAADFTDFIAHQASARRYLMLSSAEVNTIRRQHHARQIEGTQYWAVMNIDDATKGDFVRRLLEFIGCQDETVIEALRVLALVPPPPRRAALLSVA